MRENSRLFSPTYARYLSVVEAAMMLLAIVISAFALLAGAFTSSFIGQFSGLPLTFLVGAIGAFLVLLVVLVGIIVAMFSVHQDREHEKELEKPPVETAPIVAVQEEPPPPALATTTTNQAHEDYKRALLLAESTLREVRKIADGETLDGKPFSYDRCHEAKLFSRWEDWSRVVRILEAANVGRDLRKSSWKINVNNVVQAEQRLKQYYLNLGYIQVNGIWMKK